MLRLLDSFHNFVLPLLRGLEGVCLCTCGSDQDYQVFPYYEGHVMLNTREMYRVNSLVTKQDLDFMVGVAAGLFINWFIILLHGAWNKSYRWQWESRVIEFFSWPFIQRNSIIRTTFAMFFPFTQSKGKN